MENIVELNDSKIITPILNRAFLTFAQEFNFSKENAPNHLAFIDSDGVEVWLNKGLKMYGYKIDGNIIGCAGYSYYKDQVYLIERLATLPEYRNLGIGKKLDLFGNPVGSLTVLYFFGQKPCKNAGFIRKLFGN